MEKILIKLFIIFILINSTFLIGYSQEFPDKLILSTDDTIRCRVNMINERNAFISEAIKKRNGKIKPNSKTISLSMIKDIVLQSKPTISNKNYIFLLDRFKKEFYQNDCEVYNLEYDYNTKEIISETRHPVIFNVGVPQTWIGVSSINERKFFTITQSDYGQAFIDVLQGANVIINLSNNKKIKLTADRNFSTINKTRFIVGGSDFFEANVIEVNANNTLKLLLPIEPNQLIEIVNSKILSIFIETATSSLTIKIDSDQIEKSTKGCKCGLFMN